jgi:Ca2+-binding RTX toxin-like protein
MAFIGGTGNDVLIGTIAAEKLRGFAGDDVLDGRGGLDSMYGDAGNDILYYRPGALISGGADIDTLRMDYSTRSTAVSLNFTATNLLVTGIEVLSGVLSSHNDVIRLGAVTGGDAFMNDIILDGGLGFDTLSLDYRTLSELNPINFFSNGAAMRVSILNSAGFTTQQFFTSFESIALHGGNGRDSISFMADFFDPYNLQIVFYGEGGDDFIQVATNNNVIYGGSGNDRIEVYSGPGDVDRIYGGDGNDLVITDRTTTNLFGGAGIDQLDLSLGASTAGVNLGFVTGGLYKDFEFYSGFLTDHDDTVKIIWRAAPGSSWSNELDATGGNDTLTLDFGQLLQGIEAYDFNGGVYLFELIGSSDFSVAAFEKMTLLGSGYRDIFGAFNGLTTIYGRGGSDEISGSLGDDHFYGGMGNDFVSGDSGNDAIYGGDGRDNIEGGDGDDHLWGELGNDTVFGDTGNDYLNGGDGNDELFGVFGSDTLWGGAGEDSLYGGYSNDVIYGSDGNDIVYGDKEGGFSVGNDKLYGGAGNDLIFGGLGNDFVNGGAGNDRIYSAENFAEVGSIVHELNDTLIGEAGDDLLEAGFGDDRLYGGIGNDALHGGDGVDSYFGGEGADRFVFDLLNLSLTDSRDFIYDYTAGEVISLVNVDLGVTTVSVVTGTTNTTISWWNGSITLLNYIGEVTIVQNLDQPI